MTKKRLDRRYLSTTMLCGASALAAMAYTAPAVAQSDAADEGDIIFVTGSRIARTDLTSTSPISVLDQEALEISGINAVQDILNELPQAGVPGITDTNSNFSTTAQGVNFVNLRNLQSERTLVLVNSRRHIGGLAGAPTVDVNMIPAPLVERIDIVTGGASAVYGSEAIAGVVNFIYKDDFEGVEVGGRYGNSEAGGAEDLDFYFLAGGNFADGRGNATVYAGYSDRGILESRQRDISASDAVNSSFGPNGSFNIPGTGSFITLDEGTGLWNKPFVNAEDGFDRNAVRLIRVPTERLQFNANLNYDINDNITFFSESSYMNVQSRSRLEPSIAGQFISVGSIPNLRIPVDNPFIPAELQTLIDDANAGLTTPEDEILFRRRFTEIGPRSNDNQRQVFRSAFGIEGDLPESMGGFSYELYYQFGTFTQDIVGGGVYNTANFLNALNVEDDGMGGLQCVDSLARDLGCVPLNLFGGAGSISGDALAYIQTGQQTTARMEQNVLAGNITGDLTELPAGPLGFAAGFEYREEFSSFTSDALAQTGLTSGNTTPNTSGRYDVYEFFGEVNIPLLADAAFADYLGLEGAVRYADYSTIGGAVSWKAAAEWRPYPDLTIRGGYNTAIRAPNIDELFDPGSETFRSFVDPCNFAGAGGASADGTTVFTAQSAEVQANCATITGAATLDQGAINIRSAGGLAAGNPDLEEEEANTWTVGMVFSPSQIPGLNVKVDYYNISIENAIRNFTAQETVDQCVRQPGFPNNPFCQLIERNPTQAFVERIDALEINAALFEADGIDFSADYSFDIQDVGMRLNLDGNYRIKETTTAFVGGEVVEDAGEVGAQEWTINGSVVANWQDLRAAWSTRFISGVNVDNDNLSFGTIPSFFYHDVNFNYQVTEFADISFGVNNLFDKIPPFLGQGTNGDVTGTNTASDVYDVIGRNYYVSVRGRF